MTQVTIVGNLTADPELRFTPKGAAVANFTVAESSRVKDGDKWVDGPSVFWRCEIWREAAENMVESLHRGDRVVAVGEVRQRTFETSSGEKRTVTEVTCSEVGPSLKWATASVEKRGKTKPKTDDPWGVEPSGDLPF